MLRSVDQYCHVLSMSWRSRLRLVCGDSVTVKEDITWIDGMEAARAILLDVLDRIEAQSLISSFVERPDLSGGHARCVTEVWKAIILPLKPP